VLRRPAQHANWRRQPQVGTVMLQAHCAAMVLLLTEQSTAKLVSQSCLCCVCRRFWIYLLMQTFVVLWGLLISGSSLAECLAPSAIRGAGGCWTLAPVRSVFCVFHYSVPDEFNGGASGIVRQPCCQCLLRCIAPGLPSSISWLQPASGHPCNARCRATVLLFASMLLLALFLLFGSLWALHTYLACSAQTTYELLKGQQPVCDFVSHTDGMSTKISITCMFQVAFLTATAALCRHSGPLLVDLLCNVQWSAQPAGPVLQPLARAHPALDDRQPTASTIQ